VPEKEEKYIAKFSPIRYNDFSEKMSRAFSAARLLERKRRYSLEILIKQGRLVDPVVGIGGVMDIWIEDGKVAGIGSNLNAPDAQVIDARGLTVCAGLVDMHVHLREPGFEYKETIETGCRAAARGGVTSIACMANTKPVVDTPEGVAFILRQAQNACGVRVLPIAAVSVGQQGKKLTDAAALAQAGAVALSDDGVPIQDADLMRDALIKAGRQHLPVLTHCEDAGMVRNYAVNEGVVSRHLGIPGRPAIAEELMVMRDAMLAEETGRAVHICHVSTARSVEIVRQFKARGVPITCETCPQYFTLTEDEVLTQGSMARVNPPLRTQKDVDAIIVGLQDGTIDAIVTDHAPHSAEEKARPLEQAPSGMVGLETSLAVSLTALVHTGKLDLSTLLRKMTIGPARILGLNQGHLALGADADAVIFDPDEEWVVDPEQFASKGRNTPFAGRRLKGRVKYTIVGGTVIYQDQ
jgi:dihydroorotase